jgi:hypothetical protein
MPPTIIISAYNRPAALARLLISLERAQYPTDSQVRLIISIDHGPDGIHKGVLETAQTFKWSTGQKEIIEQSERLGLLKHIMACGRLSGQVGDIIFLEDDLLVSPSFYAYATQALDFYRDDERIAGHCLYGLWFNGYTQQPFVPLSDGGDTFFLQVPYTQGQAFTARQWAAMESWIGTEPSHKPASGLLHDSFSRFDAEDWFPAFARYAVGAGRFTVYPRVSLTTGAGDPGTHFTGKSNFFEVPLQRGKTQFAFKPFDEADAVYDSFFEILPNRLNRLTDALKPYDCAVDLYATKSAPHLQSEYVLTTRSSRNAIKTFGQQRWPMEMNVVDGVAGNGICLCKTTDINWGGWANLETRKQNHDYFTRGKRLSRWLRFKFALVAGWRRLRGGR